MLNITVEEYGELTKSIVDSANDSIIVFDDASRVRGWNKSASEMFGWAYEDAQGKKMTDLIIPSRFHEDHFQGIRDFLSTGESPTLDGPTEAVVRRMDGSEFDVEFTCSAIEWRDSYVFVAILRDISERKSVEEKLRKYSADLERRNREKDELILKLSRLKEHFEESANTDPLTGLLNRRGMLEKLDYERIRFQRNKNLFSIVIADIDHFKKINDNFGHEAGDYILKETAKIFLLISRKQDSVCRWGGEEFLFLLPETDLSGADNWSDRVRSLVKNHNFIYNDVTIPVTISFGVNVFDDNHLSVEDCIKRADERLYRAKQNGRNQVISSG